MTGKRKPTPIKAFELNVADAQWLLDTASALGNNRQRRMRQEFRDKIGEALKIPQKDRETLDCIENAEILIVIKPGATVQRGHVKDLSALHRQAVVAACAALETYVADAVLARVGPVLRASGDLPPRLGSVTLNINDWRAITGYTRQRRGLREKVLVPHIREIASTAPNQIGKALNLIGVDDWSRKVDNKRGVCKGTTVQELDELTKRRNGIVHQGDRSGYGRARITQEKAQRFVTIAKEVAEAIENVLMELPTE